MSLRTVFLALILLSTTRAATAQVEARTPAPAPEPTPPPPQPKPHWSDSIKLSGFIQAQLTAAEDSGKGVNAQGAPQNRDRFEIRRGRLKLTYSQEPAEAVLHIDATNSGFRLLDAEVSGKLKWHGDAYTKLTAGLFRIPFGYEQQESMSVHPFPERSMFVSRFFPGVRDVGARVWGAAWNDALIYQLALQNGQPIGDSTFPGLDPNGFKDITARVGTKLGGFKGGLSALIGKGYIAPAEDDEGTADVDETHDHIDYDRWAIGLDAVLAIDIEPLGELTLLGELGYAQNLDRLSAATLPEVVIVDDAATDDVTDTKHLGFYAGFQQQLGELFAAGVRYDNFDPDLDTDDDTLQAVTLVAHAYPASMFRLTAAYELRFEEPAVKNNVLWLRAQAKY